MSPSQSQQHQDQAEQRTGPATATTSTVHDGPDGSRGVVVFSDTRDPGMEAPVTPAERLVEERVATQAAARMALP